MIDWSRMRAGRRVLLALLLTLFCGCMQAEAGKAFAVKKAAPAAKPAPNFRQNGLTQLRALARGVKDEDGGTPDWLRAYQYWYQQRAYPRDAVDWGAYVRARARRDRMGATRQRAGIRASAVPTAWQFMGPTNLSVPYRTYYGQGTINGRVNAVAWVPGSSSSFYLGAASGGFWKTTNSGQTWTCLSDQWPNPTTNSIAVDPSNPKVIYVGTGDAAYPGQIGSGIMKTTDGGATWKQFAAAQFENNPVTKIIIDPETPSSLVAVTGRGPLQGSGKIWRSTDAGATWTAAVTPTSDWLSADVSVKDANGNRTYYAAGSNFGGDIYRSADRGKTWKKLTVGGLNQNQYEAQIAIAASQTSATTVYALVGAEQKVLKSTDSGDNWTDISAGFPSDQTPNSGDAFNWRQYWYDFHITTSKWTDANNNVQDVVYVGLLDIAASLDGGSTWVSAASVLNGGALTHSDQHAMAINPNDANVALVGNDGGVFVMTFNPGSKSFTFDTSINKGLGITQFYKIAVHPTDPSRAIGGTQDNATPVALGDLSTWSNVAGGDGGYVAVNPKNPQVQYATIYDATVIRTGDQWTSETDISPNTGGDNQPFITPITLDPSNPDILYMGTNYLWQWNDKTSAWTPRLGNQILAGGQQVISNIAVAPSDSKRIYTGSLDGQVWMTTDGGNSWKQLSAGLPNRSVSYIAVYPNQPNTILVAMSGTGTAHLWKCADTTAVKPQWVSLDGPVNGASSLPDISLNAIATDPTNPDSFLVAGTDVGLFVSTNGGGTWTNATNALGLPNVQVNDIKINLATDLLVVGTYGRGMWRIGYSTLTNTSSISGQVTDGGLGVGGVTVTVGKRSVLTAPDGSYTVGGLQDGTYDVTPSYPNAQFIPTTQKVTVGPNKTNVNFNILRFYSITGKATSDGVPLEGVTIQAGGKTTTTAADGTYKLDALSTNAYPVTASAAGYVFAPNPRIIVVGPDATNVDFEGTRVYQVTGTVSVNGFGLGGAKVTAGGTTAITQPNGSYTLVLPAGIVDVVPTLGGYTFNPVARTLNVAADTPNVNFDATAIFSVKGRVTRKGLSFFGVTVSAGGKTATTDQNGAYELKGLTAGIYDVKASRQGYLFAPDKISVVLGPDAPQVDFEGTPVLTITGRISEGAAPLGGVTVQAQSSTGATFTGTSASDGTYSVTGLSAGAYTVTPSRPGYAFSPRSRQFNIQVDTPAVDFTAAKSYNVSGAVTVNGQPLKGVSVAAGDLKVTTADDGTYVFNGLTPGVYTITPSLDSYLFEKPSITLTVDGDKTGQNFAARRVFFLSGRVTENGAGLAGVTVSAGGKSVDTATDGSYKIAELAPGTYAVSATLAGYSFQTATPSVTLGGAANNGNVVGVDFLATRIFTISGKALLNGGGLAGVTVSAGNVSVTTGADGSYALTGLPAGTYAVTAAKTGYAFAPPSASVTIGPDAQDVNFGATEVFSITGHVLKDGQGVGGVQITAGNVTATTDASGAYRLDGLLAITYVVRASAPGLTFNPSFQTLTLGPSASNVDFSARSGFSISGHVTSGVTGLAGVKVSAGGVNVTTGDDGAYTLSGLAAGSYVVMASKTGFAFTPASRSVTVGPDAASVDFSAATGPTLTRVTLSASSVKGGKKVKGTVTFSQPVTSNVTVTLAGGQGATPTPLVVVVKRGKSTANFTVQTSRVTSQLTVNIRATANGVTVSAPLTLTP